MEIEYMTYGVSRTFGSTTYKTEGHETHEEALLEVYNLAFEDGLWEPRALRKKWWQFWMPKVHNYTEQIFLNERESDG